MAPRLAVIAAVALAAATVAQTPDWTVIPTISSAPSTLDAPPVGCTCADNSSPCTRYDCPCVCNLRAGQCDPNCCCDSECTAAEVGRFRALGTCLPEGPANRTLRNCVDTDVARSLVAVNPKARMSVERSPALDSVLCITVDRLPIQGSYYSDPGPQSPDVLSQPAIARASSFRTQGRPGRSTSLPARYDIGMPLLAATTSGSSRRPAFGGYWSLPARLPGGSCSMADGGVFARFRVDAGPSTCTTTRVFDASGDTCAALGSTRMLSGLQVGTNPTASLVTAGDFTTVSVSTVRTMNAATGALTMGTSADLTNTWTAGSCSCSGVVTAISYSVSYDPASGLVSGVAADVVVTTLTQASGCGTLPVTVPLTTAVSYSPTSLAGGGYGSNAAALYGRSGAPGYLVGSPVLAGVLVAQSGANPLSSSSLAGTDRLAIGRGLPPGHMSVFANQLQAASSVTGSASTTSGFALAGLKLRGPASDGSCVAYNPVSPPAEGTDASMPVPVLFGSDSTITCGVKLTRAALANLCSTQGGAAVKYYFGSYAVNASAVSPAASVTHVGTLGNADPWKAWQWTRLSDAGATPAATWDAARGVCSNILSGMDVEFLYTRVGETSNPQRKILAARVTYPVDSWAWGREDSPASGATTQTFLVRTTVTFTEWNPVRSQDYIPPAPPIIPRMPSDLWYPFETARGSQDGQYIVASGAGQGAGQGAGLVAALATAAVTLALVGWTGRGE